MKTPLHRWTSLDIAAWIRGAPRSGPLPEPGHHARPLVNGESAMHEFSTEAPEWADTAPRNHRRDAALRLPHTVPGLCGLTANQRRILRLLADLDARCLPGGTRLHLCTNRRRLRASAEAMQELWQLGLVNGAGSRDAWGTGNTPASSWWWLSSAGLQLFADTSRGAA